MKPKASKKLAVSQSTGRDRATDGDGSLPAPAKETTVSGHRSPGQRGSKREPAVSLAPLDLEEAIKGLFAVTPDDEPKRPRRSGRKS